MAERFENYVKDLSLIIKEMAFDAKKLRDNAKNEKEKLYATGYLMGFHRVISLMQQQTLGFQIKLEELFLNDIEPDNDLI